MMRGETIKTPTHWLPVSSSMTGAVASSKMTTRDDIIVQVVDETVDGADKLPIAWHVPATSDIVLNASKIAGMEVLLGLSKRELDDYCSTRLSGSYGSIKTSGLDIDSTPATAQDKALIRVFGVLAHEAAHSKWSHFILEDWYLDLAERDRRIVAVIDDLDEVRIESMQAEYRDVFRTAMRASSRMLLPTEEEMAELTSARGGLSVPAFASTSALTLGRADRGILLDFEVAELRYLCEDVCGAERFQEMRRIWCDFAEIDQDDAERDMPVLAQEWLDLFADENEELEMPGMAAIVIAAVGDAAKSAETWDALAADATRTPNDMADAAEESDKIFEVRGHGYSRGKRGSRSTRPPTSEETAQAVSLARELEKLQLRARSATKTSSLAPPGKLKTRAALAQSADRAAGRMTSAEPWQRVVRKRNDSPPLAVGVITDVSGSMRWAEDLVAKFLYIVPRAVKHIGGKSAAAVFGEDAEPILGVSDKVTQVTTRRAIDGSEAFNSACAAVVGQLRLDDPGSGARILFVVTDGQLVAPGEMEAAAKWVDHLNRRGCVVVWVTDSRRGERYGGLPCTPRGAKAVVTNARTYDAELERAMIAEVKKAYSGR
jgi:hypothetical protein